jgi:hypothetical protein
MNLYKMIESIKNEIFNNRNINVSEIITEIELNRIDVNKLSSILQNVQCLIIGGKNEVIHFSNILFQKYGYLFEKLEYIQILFDDKIYIPSKLKRLRTEYPYLIMSNEKICTEELICEGVIDNDDDLSTIFDFESIKRLDVDISGTYWKSYIKKMINLETLSIYNSNILTDLDISHLDKLNHVNKYSGVYPLPESIVSLNYNVNANVFNKLPSQLKLLDLRFTKNIGFIELSNNNVEELCIDTTILLNDVYCHFPNLTALYINSYKLDNTNFINRILSDYKKIEILSIECHSNLDFDLINNIDINDLSIKNSKFTEKYHIKSDTIECLHLTSNVHEIELSTKKLLNLIIEMDNEQSNIVIYISQDDILDEITILGRHGRINLQECKTNTLDIRSYHYIDLVLPSYYKHLLVYDHLCLSWLNYDVETLTLDRTTYNITKNEMTIDRDNIYAPYLKKIIIKSSPNDNTFEWNKYLTVSDNCEIEYQISN